MAAYAVTLRARHPSCDVGGEQALSKRLELEGKYERSTHLLGRHRKERLEALSEGNWPAPVNEIIPYYATT